MIYDRSLLLELDMLVEDMHKSNQDMPIAIFGDEGTGKSSFSENLAVFLDRTFTKDAVRTRVAQTFEDFALKAPDTEPYHVIWWDEAHRFSKRGSFDTDINRVLLEYFQDIRGARRIYLLCFPELREIDRKVIQRCKLFFETIKNGNEFQVRGWTKKQILATIDCYRLPSAKSKALRWAGLPFNPIRVFRHDYKDFPEASKCSQRHEPIPSVDELNNDYKLLKEGSLRRSDFKLKQYGCRDPMDVANELIRLTTYSPEWARDAAYKATKTALVEGWFDEQELELVNGRFHKIRSDNAFKKIIEYCLINVDQVRLRSDCKKIENTQHLVSDISKEENCVTPELIA